MRDTRTLKGFLLSFLLHLLIFLLFFFSLKELKVTTHPPMQHEKRITLNLSRFTPPAPKPQPKAKPQTIMPPKALKKSVEIKPEPKPKPVPVAQKRHLKKSKEDNNLTKMVKKESSKEKKKIVKAKSLAGVLLGNPKRSHSKSHTLHYNRLNRMIQRMYGKEFNSFTKTQQKFIQNHLSEIQRITQNTLVINGYPDVAVRTGQQGTNVVSFYLHPNGDISHLRLVKPMGYEALDKNTIAVIEIAYKDYPHPKTKTKIVFYVNYSLY